MLFQILFYPLPLHTYIHIYGKCVEIILRRSFMLLLLDSFYSTADLGHFSKLVSMWISLTNSDRRRISRGLDASEFVQHSPDSWTRQSLLLLDCSGRSCALVPTYICFFSRDRGAQLLFCKQGFCLLPSSGGFLPVKVKSIDFCLFPK